MKELYHPIILGIREMEKPVIAAVNGPAVGIGCSLALDCDLILAAESSYFLLAFVNIGLVPDGGITALLPAKAGVARSDRDGDAGGEGPRRAGAGVGNHQPRAPRRRLVEDAEQLLEHLATGPTRSYANFKKLINRRVYAGMAKQLEAEADAQAEQGQTADFVEGVLAFVQKRPPSSRAAEPERKGAADLQPLLRPSGI